MLSLVIFIWGLNYVIYCWFNNWHLMKCICLIALVYRQTQFCSSESLNTSRSLMFVCSKQGLFLLIHFVPKSLEIWVLFIYLFINNTYLASVYIYICVMMLFSCYQGFIFTGIYMVIYSLYFRSNLVSNVLAVQSVATIPVILDLFVYKDFPVYLRLGSDYIAGCFHPHTPSPSSHLHSSSSSSSSPRLWMQTIIISQTLYYKRKGKCSLFYSLYFSLKTIHMKMNILSSFTRPHVSFECREVE